MKRLVQLSKEFCLPCQVAKHHIETIIKPKPELYEYVDLGITENLKKYGQLIARYHIKSVPAFFVLDEKNQVIHFLNKNKHHAYSWLKSAMNINENIKRECEDLYAKIKAAETRLAELRKICPHEQTFEGDYSDRIGSNAKAEICTYCGELIKFLPYETINI